MHHIKRYIIFVLLVSTAAFADVSPVVVKGDFSVAHVNGHAAFYKDQSHQYSLDDIRNIEDDFAPYDNRIFKSVYSSSSVWYRFTIQNTTNEVMPLLLECQYPSLDDVVLYYRNDRFEYEFHTGDNTPFHLRPIPDENFVFPVNAIPGSTTCFLKINSLSPISFPMYLYSQDTFKNKKDTDHFSTGILAGYVIFFVVFYLVIFFYSRKAIFLASMLIMLNIGFAALHENGILYRFLWPGNVQLNNIAALINFMVGLCLLIMGINYFESQDKTEKTFKKYSRLVPVGALILCIATLFLDFSIARKIIYSYFIFNLTLTYIFVIKIYGSDTLYRPAIIGYTVWIVYLYFDTVLLNIIANNYFSPQFNHMIRPIFGLTSFTLWGIGLMIIGGQSHRKRVIAEEELVRKIKKSEELQTEFINDLTHELATPLQTIMYSTEKIKRLKMEEALSTYINRIQSASNRISTLIQNFLESARSDNYKLNMNVHKEDLRKIIKNIIFELGTIAAETSHEIIFKTEQNDTDDAYYLHIDRIYIEQAIFNIITNSIKYTPKGGKILVLLKRNNNTITVSIADNGYGIPETAAKAIFEPYYRIGFLNPFSAGVGLGLSISKKWVEAHGGWIECKSPLPQPYSETLHVDNIKKGSLFIIHLPLRSTPTE